MQTSSNGEVGSPNTINANMNKSRKKHKSDVTKDPQITGETLALPKNRTQGKAKAGQLEGLMSLPMDLLYEIFGHLLPLDTLHLARTTKAFRRVLMHKSSISVWKAARANVWGFPECPPGMSEPAYANLAFDQHCHICLARNIRSVEWRLRLRICSKCAKIKLMELFLSDTMNVLVPNRPSKPYRVMCYVKDLKTVGDHLKSLDDTNLRNAYYNHRMDFVREVQTHAILCEDWAAETKVNRSQELEDARQDRKHAIIDKLTDLGWGDEIEQILPRDDLGHHRLVKQPTRLTDRIWKNIKDPLVYYMERIKVDRLKRERQALIISRKPAAINILRAYKISRLPLTEVMPEPVDFCAFPEVQAVLELPNDASIDESSFSEIVPLLPGIFDRWRMVIIQKLAARVRQAHEDERALRDQEYAITRTFVGPEPTSEVVEDPAEKMKLATTVFKCRNCVEMDDGFRDEELYGDVSLACHRPIASADFTYPLFYPKVLGHRCLTVVPDKIYDPPTRDPSIKLDMNLSPWVAAKQFRHRQHWDSGCLAIDSRAGEIVEHIIRAGGLDPATTTAEDMDTLDTRLGCLECTKWSNADQTTSISVFGWRSAVQHQLLLHRDKTVSWITLDKDENNFARAVEYHLTFDLAGENRKEKDTPPSSNVVVWLCAHCLDLQSQLDPQELHVTIEHLKAVHQVTSPTLDKDYFRDFEAPQGYRTDTIFEESMIERPQKY